MQDREILEGCLEIATKYWRSRLAAWFVAAGSQFYESQNMTIVYRINGWCPCCSSKAAFTATDHWYRDSLLCDNCHSIPRERALALILTKEMPDWRHRDVHESSPAERGISVVLKRECAGYVASQFYPGQPLGSMVKGFQNQNLERQTFMNNSFDLVVSLDVMEHVNDPAQVFKEIYRTLRPGGMYLFTVPTYKGKIISERRALYHEDGTVDHLSEPEYHGNPIDDSGSLVTFHYGYDLAESIYHWSGLGAEVIRFHRPDLGIIGDFTEVYIARKPAA